MSELTKSTNNDVTIIQVDKDISFVLDTRDINYGVPVSLQGKSSALSRKPYCKKYPVTCNPCVSYSDDSISVIGSSPSARSRKPMLKDSPKCTNSSLSPLKGKPGRKRPADSDDGVQEFPVHKKGRKQSPIARVAPTKINGYIASNKFKDPIELLEIQDSREESPDSDIQIVEIVNPSTSKSGSDVFRNNINDDVSRRKKPLTSILKPISSFSSNEDVPITEADTAPFMPSYSAMPRFSVSESSSSFQSSMKWLSASGTLSFPSIQNGGIVGASDPAKKFNDKFHLYFPEMKIPQDESVHVKKPKAKKELKTPKSKRELMKPIPKRRELKSLYDNLNEISWANEKNFKQLLLTNIDNRQSRRVTTEMTAVKKLQRLSTTNTQNKLSITTTKLKPELSKKNSAKLALDRAKYCNLKPKLLVKTVSKQKVPFNKVNKVNKSTLKPKKINCTKTVSRLNKVQVVKQSVLKTKKGNVIKKSGVKSNKINVKKPFVKPNKTNIKKSVIKSNVTKPVIKTIVTKQPVIKSVTKSVIKSNATKPVIKPNPAKPGIKSTLTKPVMKSNVTKPVIKSNVTNPLLKLNVMQSVMKPTKSILKSPKSLLKVRFKDVEPKNGPKVKTVSVDKKKPLIAAVASSSKNLDAFSDSFQSSAGNCSYSASNSNSGLFSAFGKNMLKTDNFSEFKNSSFVKELQKYDVSNELQVLKHASSDKVLEAAMKKGSKLRVTVEPIEHTKLWNADFFEAFKKHVLEQAFLQTFERRDQESINSMFQELQEACFHPPNSVKPFKKKKATDDEVLRSSVRQIEKGFGYKEIFVKKMDNYFQFVLLPHACKLNSLNIEAIKELKEAFIQAKKDPTCRAVLLNSSGTYFCTGIELSLLVGSNRKQAAEEMASSIRDLILTLSTFTKPIIAAVNGTAVGLGVALLTYCDVVLASDKATFCIPATRLGYVPEGGVTLTLPQVVGSGVATEMLLYGRRLTAEQALRHGLVSEVLWPTHLMNEVVPRMKTICSQSLQVMEATKTMVRCHLWDKLKTHIEREWRLLPPLWLDAQCQHKIKAMLETGWLID